MVSVGVNNSAPLVLVIIVGDYVTGSNLPYRPPVPVVVDLKHVSAPMSVTPLCSRRRPRQHSRATRRLIDRRPRRRCAWGGT